MNEYLPFISNLFKKYGVKSIAMDDISWKLGISKKTLYQHFENKNDIIYKVMEFEIKSEYDELNRLISLHSNAIDQALILSKRILNSLRAINDSVTYDMRKYYPQIWEKLINQRKEYILKIIKLNFQLGIKQGIYRKNLNTNIIAVIYAFRLDLNGLEIYKDRLNTDFDKMFNTLFMLHLRGIANKKGIDYLEEQFNNARAND